MLNSRHYSQDRHMTGQGTTTDRTGQDRSGRTCCRRHGGRTWLRAKAWGAAILLAAVTVLDLFAGDIRLSPADIFSALSGDGSSEAARILVLVRLPRVLTALTAGAALALSGAQMQSIFRNRLADPHIMGVSAGAGLGAAVAALALPAAMSPAFTGLSMAAAASAGALASAALILAVSFRMKRSSSLLICGVMAGFIISAIISILQFGAGAEELKMFYSWSAGNFTGTGMGGVTIMAVALLAGAAIAAANAKGLDIMLFGDEFALLSGARPRQTRTAALFSASLMTGAVTAFCGPIGFVGIVAPHMARRLSGTARHAAVLPMSMATGGLFGVTADLLCQAGSLPVPAGSMMALTGIPFVLAMIISGKD